MFSWTWAASASASSSVVAAEMRASTACRRLAVQQIVLRQIVEHAGDVVDGLGGGAIGLIPEPRHLAPARAKVIAQARPMKPDPTIAVFIWPFQRFRHCHRLPAIGPRY